MPKVSKAKSKPAKKSREKCSICLSTMKNTATLSYGDKRSCKHKFCFNCIHQWVCNSRLTCPLCRTEFNRIRSKKRNIKIIVNHDLPLQFVLALLESFQENENNRQVFETRLRELKMEEVQIYRRIQRLLSDETYLSLAGIDVTDGFKTWFSTLLPLLTGSPGDPIHLTD